MNQIPEGAEELLGRVESALRKITDALGNPTMKNVNERTLKVLAIEDLKRLRSLMAEQEKRVKESKVEASMEIVQQILDDVKGMTGAEDIAKQVPKSFQTIFGVAWIPG